MSRGWFSTFIDRPISTTVLASQPRYSCGEHGQLIAAAISVS
ncbi:hypothetical protein [Brucella pituitosa]